MCVMAANVKLGFFGRIKKAFVLGSREYRRLAAICDGEIVAMGRLRRDLEAREAELVHLRGLLDEADKLLAGDVGEVCELLDAGCELRDARRDKDDLGRAMGYVYC